MHTRLQRCRGFTLAHFSVGLALIAYASGLGNYINQHQRVTEDSLTATVNAMHTLGSAALAFYSTEGRWPTLPEIKAPPAGLDNYIGSFGDTSVPSVTRNPLGGEFKFRVRTSNDTSTYARYRSGGLSIEADGITQDTALHAIAARLGANTTVNTSSDTVTWELSPFAKEISHENQFADLANSVLGGVSATWTGPMRVEALVGINYNDVIRFDPRNLSTPPLPGEGIDVSGRATFVDVVVDELTTDFLSGEKSGNTRGPGRANIVMTPGSRLIVGTTNTYNSLTPRNGRIIARDYVIRP